MSRKRTGLFTAGAALIAVLAIEGTARADSTDEIELRRDEDGYGYVFPDDPLTGNDSAASSPLIRVIPAGIRRTLIRPRVHFVPEMLKSVEQL